MYSSIQKPHYELEAARLIFRLDDSGKIEAIKRVSGVIRRLHVTKCSLGLPGDLCDSETAFRCRKFRHCEIRNKRLLSRKAGM